MDLKVIAYGIVIVGLAYLAADLHKTAAFYRHQSILNPGAHSLYGVIVDNLDPAAGVFLGGAMVAFCALLFR